MAIPLPDLDDRTFESLLQDGVRTLPRRAPSWTDHNLHDPGITLLELFAWLSEMHRYSVDRIGDGHVLKFLALLGVTPRPAAPARGVVSLGPPPAAALEVPAGTRLSLAGVPFETVSGETLAPVVLVAVVSSSAGGLVDRTESNRREALAYSAFGDGAEAGERLYLGFDRAFPAGVFALDVTLFEDYRDARGDPVPRGAHAGEPVDLVPSAGIAWELSAPGGSWAPLDVVEDETRELSRSGRLRFRAPGAMEARDLPPVATGLFWLRATVRRPGYELPPRLETIRLDTLPVEQRETLCAARELSAAGGTELAVPEPSYLVLEGEQRIQVLGADGLWRDDPRARVALPEPRIVFSGDPPPAGEDNVRLISTLSDFLPRQLLGAGNGLPGQLFRLRDLPVVAAELRLQILEPSADPGLPEPGWRDWTRVDDLDGSSPGDPHFTVDPASGELRFGDGLRGLPAPPPPGVGPNVRVIAHRAGGGERGNLAAGAEARLDRPPRGLESLQVGVPRAIGGGAEPETLDAARRRARRELRERHRAVTAGDFEALALATPGLRVARARALPLFSPGLEGYPETTAPATVTVVAVPFAESSRPVPSPGFLTTVCRHLDRHRLITTRLHVVAPDYVEVAVDAVVVLAPGYREELVLGRILEALDRFLDPLAGGPDGGGWPFGRTVHLSEVYERLDGVEGLDCVRDVAITATGKGVGRDARGGVTIPPSSLVSPGSHRIRFESRQALCRAPSCSGKAGSE